MSTQEFTVRGWHSSSSGSSLAGECGSRTRMWVMPIWKCALQRKQFKRPSKVGDEDLEDPEDNDDDALLPPHDVPFSEINKGSGIPGWRCR